MIVTVITGDKINGDVIYNYFASLVNSFFKILPMREDEQESLPAYMVSLRSELLGFNQLITATNNDPMILSLLSILQFLIDNGDCSVRTVRREVFKAISICNKLKSKYCEGGVSE